MTAKRERSLAARLTKRNSALWCELSIGSVAVKVYLADPKAKAIYELGEIDGGSKLGCFDQEASIILVSWDLSDELAESVLHHELHHAAVFLGAVRLHPEDDLDFDGEEFVVNGLSSAMFDALKRNGMLTMPPRPKLPRRHR